MNPNDFVRKELEKHMVKNPCRARTRQRAIIKATLTRYRRNEFHDIDDLLHDAIQRITELSFIGRGTTVKRFATNMKISKTTARLHLLKLDHIVRNESKRPFIYKVGKS